VLHHDPTYAYAHNNRGVAWRRRGEPDRAIADFSRAIELLPTYVGALNSRGELHMLAGHPGQAIDDFRRALAVDPTHEKANQNMQAVLGAQAARR
jgi:tetratricopeptide (TPR) repeat protein